jgi:hypothetical protein
MLADFRVHGLKATFSNAFTNGWVPHCPDFLWKVVALRHSMRLSLMKGAHAELSCTAWQEIGVKPFFGLSGIHSTHLTVLSATSQFPMDAPPYPLSSRPKRTRISCHAALDMAACAAFRKESRMKFANATKFDRKSGVA